MRVDWRLRGHTSVTDSPITRKYLRMAAWNGQENENQKWISAIVKYAKSVQQRWMSIEKWRTVGSVSYNSRFDWVIDLLIRWMFHCFISLPQESAQNHNGWDILTLFLSVFFVAHTRLYTLPCWSVGRLVCRSVTFFNSEWFSHYWLAQPSATGLPCIRPRWNGSGNKILAKASDGQRYPLPLCECLCVWGG